MEGVKKLVTSNIWFLIGGILFLIGAVRAYMNEDSVGAIIYFLACVVFFIGFVLQIIYSEKSKDEKSMKISS